MEQSGNEYNILLERFQFATRAGHFGVWEYDLKNDALIWDDSMFKLYGIDQRDFKGNHDAWKQTLHPDDLNRVTKERKDALANENNFNSVFRVVTPFSEVRYIECQAVIIRQADTTPLKMIGLNKDVTEQTLKDIKLEKHRDSLIKTHEIAGVGGWEFDVLNNKLSWTKLTYDIHELPHSYKPDVESAINFYTTDSQPTIRNAIERGLVDGKGWDLELQITTAKGNRRWVRAIGETQKAQDHITHLIGTFQDITERIESLESLKYLLADLKESEAKQIALLNESESNLSRLSALLSAMNTGILFQDKNHDVEFVNSAFRKIWGIDDSENLLGVTTKDVLEKSSSYVARPDNSSKYLLKITDTHEISEKYEIELTDGRIITQLTFPVVDKQDTIIGRLWLYEDITQERQTAKQLLYLAERDPLTGLYNRSRFQLRLENLMSNARRSNASFALLYFDLDEFKSINDSFGHGTGDTVLVRTANEVLNMVRTEEILARLGGDEFALLTALNPTDDVSALAERIIKAVSSIPFRFRGKNIQLTTSIGIAIFPEHGETLEEFVAHADSAMYMAKKQGKNTWSIYDPKLDSSEIMVDRLTWNQKIVQSIENDLLDIHFQGVYDTTTKKLQHIEALIRMHEASDPEELIMPNQFIPVAEKSGLIVQLDTWMVNKCIELLSKNKKIPAIAVNISGRTISNTDFPNTINKQLLAMKVDPKRLIIEITETAAISDIQEANHFIDKLHQFNCEICLDDFGSGFATFSYLKHLNIDTLKIDGNFIRDLTNNAENQAFVKAMVDIADGLNKKCIVEFVETEEILNMVRNLGVKYAQGYYLGRPSSSFDI